MLFVRFLVSVFLYTSLNERNRYKYKCKIKSYYMIFKELWHNKILTKILINFYDTYYELIFLNNSIHFDVYIEA